jgi:site-specific DNA recombinase
VPQRASAGQAPSGREVERAQYLDLVIHLVKENVALSPGSRSTEKFMHGIKVLMAKNYIDNLSEETQKGLREKAEQGLYPSWGPIGYRNTDGPNGKRIIEPDPDVAPLAVRLFEAYATGSYSLKEVTRLARLWGLTFRSGTPLSKSVTHKILRNPIYMGRFRWAGLEYQGSHQPLISLGLWEAVQQRLDGRCAIGAHPVKHQFAFSGLISCGHCGCALVGEIKKNRYVYYHCTGYKQKCPERYTREEVLAERFGQLLRGLELDSEVLEWVATALRESHADEKREREETVVRLQAQYNLIQGRLDSMYLDKLDGRIDASFFDRKATDWRREQDGILRNIAIQEDADHNYVEDGIRLLELASEAHQLFREQGSEEKRRLLNFMVASASWKDGELSASLRPPFDLIRNGVAAAGAQPASIEGDRSRTDRVLALSNSSESPVSNSNEAFAIGSQDKMADWLPLVDALRTFLLAPTSELREILADPLAHRHLGRLLGT